MITKPPRLLLLSVGQKAHGANRHQGHDDTWPTKWLRRVTATIASLNGIVEAKKASESCRAVFSSVRVVASCCSSLLRCLWRQDCPCPSLDKLVMCWLGLSPCGNTAKTCGLLASSSTSHVTSQDSQEEVTSHELRS